MNSDMLKKRGHQNTFLAHLLGFYYFSNNPTAISNSGSLITSHSASLSSSSFTL